ncbi:helix-turn-helix transcriptional regulator [Pasteurella skyensis]|uniref:Helix-turn-helix transcriptional regulator n=1 Tax=Phocoenobacter skyensis TaxID=97481 RepID=A0AAJ6NBC7_9PAST|nr:helix-turn-helix transcriptional regulator [Pasteurella skyensis]MDP8173651.1 helix-turn-helix transcriptional regulator [Pasteurella skyensis]MDP8178019.1 helix-turn-helix transcriptional regulator [Pasteurella skyensis]
MNTLSDRLIFIRENLRLDQQDLAKLANVSQGTISNIENGVTTSPQKLLEIAEALNVDPVWLKTGKGTPDGKNTEFSNKLTENGVIRVKVLDVFASAGNGIQNSDFAENVSDIGFSEEHFRQVFNRNNADDLYLINVKGDSMQPTFESGDLIYVDTQINFFEGDGIYVFNYNGALLVKRLQFVGDELLVISDNSCYQQWSIKKDCEATFNICGKVMFSQPQKLKKFG